MGQQVSTVGGSSEPAACYWAFCRTCQPDSGRPGGAPAAPAHGRPAGAAAWRRSGQSLGDGRVRRGQIKANEGDWNHFVPLVRGLLRAMAIDLPIAASCPCPAAASNWASMQEGPFRLGWWKPCHRLRSRVERPELVGGATCAASWCPAATSRIGCEREGRGLCAHMWC